MELADGGWGSAKKPFAMSVWMVEMPVEINKEVPSEKHSAFDISIGADFGEVCA